MTLPLARGEYSVHSSTFDTQFNALLLSQFTAAQDLDKIKKTHFFNGRFENIYLSEQHVPLLEALKADAKTRASTLIGRPLKNLGCWFNAMGPGTETTLHSHDDDDELLSGVYYVRVPENSGELLIHTPKEIIRHPPHEGQWVFFAPQTPHAVSENLSGQLRLSVAFNFS